MTGRNAGRLALLAAAAILFAAPALRAECALPGAVHVSWPGTNPVWDFCYRRPNLSSGSNGSGLELSEVKFNGATVLAMAHLPILNVKYADTGESGCGGQGLCYRDWLYSEQTFECAPVISPALCTGDSTPQSASCPGGRACTVCDHPGFDAGTFFGVAVESLPDRLKLTAQCRAGWYRYIPVWEFFADGTIQARFVATSVDNTCVAYTHHHQAYFRFDVDLEGSAGNYVDEALPDNSLQRVTTERNFIDTSPARSRWRVGSAESPYVVEISRNPGDGAAGDPPAVPNDFPMADGWVLAYDPNEISDYPNLVICAANINSFDDNENVNGADVVLWVRAGALHEGEPGGFAQDCSMVGPTVRVLQVPVATNLHTVAPCRIVDTRDPAGPDGGPALAAGGTRSFVLAGKCGIPMTARSVAANLTVTQPSTNGHITAFPTGGGAPLASTLNFTAGRTRANNAVLRLGVGGAVSVSSVLPSGTVQFILDVTGYLE